MGLSTTASFQSLEVSISATKDKIRSQMQRYNDYDKCRAQVETSFAA